MPELSDLAATVPFAGELGISLTSAEPAVVTGRMPWTPERCTAAGVLHGGALMALADTLGAVCAFLSSFIVVQTQLSDDQGRSVALVRQTQAVLSGA